MADDQLVIAIAKVIDSLRAIRSNDQIGFNIKLAEADAALMEAIEDRIDQQASTRGLTALIAHHD